MQQLFLDAMGTYRAYGGPSLVITMTCTPKSEEIQSGLLLGHNRSEAGSADPVSLPELLSCELKALVADLHEGQALNEVTDPIYTIKFRRSVSPARILSSSHVGI